MFPTDKIICCDCVDGMRGLPDACVHLTVTSPPYGTMRSYGGHGWDFHLSAEQLYRVTVPGGVVAWVVQEQIIDGSESGESARQRLYFMDLGFRCHQTLVMERRGSRQYTPSRYGCPPEYAFIFSKGQPRSFNPIEDRWRKDMRPRPVSHRKHDGSLHVCTPRRPTRHVRRSAIWSYPVGKHLAQEAFAFKHPALMPERMASDLIRSWSNVGDLVFDPFAGAGTTLKMALLNNRRFLGFEFNAVYVEVARRRIEEAVRIE